LDVAYAAINYLEQSGLIKGEKPNGEKCPMWVSITYQGIDALERTQQDLAQLHDEIRSRILTRLKEHISGHHDEETIVIDRNFIQSLGLKDSEFNLVAGELNYLEYQGRIEGYRQMGLAYPYRVKITSRGIYSY
jgi:hypothetical protein